MNENVKNQALFAEKPVWESVLRLALPSVVGQIILVLYNMADTFFVGLTGSDAMITAVTVCMPAFLFLSAIANLFGVGGSSVISRSLGQRDEDRARSASSFAFWGCVLTTLLYSLGAFLLLDGFLDLLGGGDAIVHANARQYLFVTVVLGGLFTALNNLFAHLVRAEGRSLQASIGIALGGILNIALDPLFMFVVLPAGNEALGAGIATALSNVAALLYYIVVLLLHRRRLVLSLRPGRRIFTRHIPRDVVASGIPACLMTLCENISYAILDRLMFEVGTAAQAGVGVAKKVNMLAHCIVRGMAQGVLPLIGYNFASGDRRRMKQTVTLSAGMSIVISGLCMTVSLIFGRGLVGLFIQTESASLDFGTVFLRIMCVGAPFSAFAYTVISFFQATGHGGKSLVLALLRKGLLDIPMMFLFGNLLPIYGIVLATPVADILCCCVSLLLFLDFLRRHASDPAPAPRRLRAAKEPSPCADTDPRIDIDRT